jgi:hypothetical protein
MKQKINEVYLPRTGQQNRKMALSKYQNDVNASQNNKLLRNRLADIKLQQYNSLQQQ